MGSKTFKLRELITHTLDGEWGKDIKSANLITMRVIRGTDFEAVAQGDLSSVPIRQIEMKAARRKTLQVNDVLIETAGGSKKKPTGRTVLISQRIIDTSNLPLICASFARFMRFDAQETTGAYIYWHLQNLYKRGILISYQVQHTGVARFQFTDFAANHEVSLPPLPIQRRIAAILSAFDEKIELNRQMNRTLEQMARALFKSWFVDFDPVRAKMRGEQPIGMDSETAALFPDALEEVEGREIPKGWEVIPLHDICIYLSRGIAPKYTTQKGLTIINQKCIRNFQIDLSKARKHDLEKKSINQDKIIQKWDVLINSTGVGTLGRLAQFITSKYQCSVDTHVTIARPKQDKVCPVFFGEQLNSLQPTIESLGAGSTGQTELRRTALGELSFLLPSFPIMNAFATTITPLKLQSIHNLQEYQTLAQLRDALLPKLLSGEIDVSEWGDN